MRYHRSSTFLAALLAALPLFVHSSSRLQVQIPRSLSKSDGYDHRGALFGHLPSSGTIAQNVYYADSDLCDPNVDTHIGFPRRPLQTNGRMQPWIPPYILMVDRGQCTFVSKVRNAQRAGAAAVIIADNTCQCGVLECTSTPGIPCEYQEPIMADDGSGSDVSIPSVLMFKHDADPLIQWMKQQDQQLNIEISWSLPADQTVDRVEYQLWTQPGIDALEFKNAAVRLGSQAVFSPHMMIYSGERNGCLGAALSGCDMACTNGGRYCATAIPEQNVTGANVVTESLRRICIWKTYGEQDGIGEVWWDYVQAFDKRCGKTSGLFADEVCIQSAMAHARVEQDVVNACVANSGGLEEGVNSLLESEVLEKDNLGVVKVPSLFVNSFPVRGHVTFDNLFTAICARYGSNVIPTICKLCATCTGEMKACVESGGTCRSRSYTNADLRLSGGPENVSAPIFLVSLFCLVASLMGIGTVYYKRTQENMQTQLRDIIAEYVPLEDQDESEAT